MISDGRAVIGLLRDFVSKRNLRVDMCRQRDLE